MLDNSLLDKVNEYNHKKWLCYIDNLPFEINYDFERILSARYMKVSRIKKALIYLMSRYNYIWFCTFTFNDYYISKSDRTKKDLIKNVLNNYDFKYIMNQDFGSQTEREHYHCIVATNTEVQLDYFLEFTYPCFSSALLCNDSLDDCKKLSKYLNKLSNHCVKSSTKNSRLYYNFKPYVLFPDEYSKWLAYTLDKVTLLDKGNITGKIDFTSKNI